VVEIKASPFVRLFRVTVPVGYAGTNIYLTLPDGTEYRQAATTTAPVTTVTPTQRAELLLSMGTQGMPPGIEMISYFGGQFYGTVYMAQQDQTVLWCSDPLAYHLWRPDTEGFLLPGRVAMLKNHAEKGLVLGTTQRCYFYDGDKLDAIADYGVVPGEAGDVDGEGMVYFWTERGICKAMPFANMTEAKVSMPPGQLARSKLLYLGGIMQFVTLTEGTSQAFNQRSERS
jgi:hypothetical protein